MSPNHHTLRHMMLFALLSALGVLTSAPAQGGDYALVVHPSNKVDNLSLREMSAIFKAEKQGWGKGKQIYLILPKSSTEEHAFLLAKVYHMTDVELARYWIELRYRNKIAARPKSLARGMLTINVVRRRSKAIALVRLEDLPEEGKVKVLSIDGLRPGEKNYPLSDPGGAESSAVIVGDASVRRPQDNGGHEQRIASLEGMVDDLIGAMIEGEEGFGGSPALEFGGFGHIEFAAEDNGAATDNQFALGGLDLFIQSRLSDRISFLNETVFEPTEDGKYVLDVERVILKYDFSDLLNVQAGRFHTTIGHWNEAYHHGEWLQTAIGRPRIFDFEDEDGLLPVHLVGVSLQGRYDADLGVVDYKFEAGNGRGRTPDPPQVTVDANDAKAINVALGFSPAALGDLRIGASAYFDKIPAAAGVHREMDERIVSLFATYQSRDWELLAEAIRIDHDESGGAKTDTEGYYAQVGRRLGDFTPYLRFDTVHVDDADTFFASNDDEDTYAIGVRWDFSKWTALKLQYEHTEFHLPGGGESDMDALRIQASFAF